MPAYKWLTWLQAQQALAARLADTSNVFWTIPENKLYLIESLRVWNALTEIWNTDFAFTATPATAWFNTSIIPGSPRVRTVTDTDLYTLMEYHLLEPASGGTWTGTTQFSIADLSGALQRRRDEMIQATGCNLWPIALPSVPNTRRTAFPDSSLEPRRARFIPAGQFGDPVTLLREDTYAFDGFESDHLQTVRTPLSWSVISGPPLSMDVDTAPDTPGNYDVISLQSGFPLNPPAATLLGVPDDWSWLPKWGALSDLLGRDSEATDRARADYCLRRYMTGLEIMKQSNWLLAARLNGIPVDTPSVIDQDGFSAEWQNNPSAYPALVTAGIDLCLPCPLPNPFVGVSVTLVGNAPIPILDGDFVQISRDDFDVILDYAQVLAQFKQGGEEFSSTKDLEKNFITAAAATNKRLAAMGIFRDELGLQGRRQDIGQPRTDAS